MTQRPQFLLYPLPCEYILKKIKRNKPPAFSCSQRRGWREDTDSVPSRSFPWQSHPWADTETWKYPKFPHLFHTSCPKIHSHRLPRRPHLLKLVSLAVEWIRFSLHCKYAPAWTYKSTPLKMINSKRKINNFIIFKDSSRGQRSKLSSFPNKTVFP